MENSENSGEFFFKETKYVTMFIHEGIYQATFKPLDTLGIEIAAATVQDRLDFFNKTACPCLFDITAVKQTTKEARDFMATEGNQLVLASAMIVTSPMLKMMANFYILVNKPTNPTRLFTDRESGLNWLRTFSNKL